MPGDNRLQISPCFNGNPGAFPLALANDGERVRIVSVRSGRNLHERLSSMGIHVDDVVKVIQRHHRGAVIISKDGSRYGLGGGMAQKILVEKE